MIPDLLSPIIRAFIVILLPTSSPSLEQTTLAITVPVRCLLLPYGAFRKAVPRKKTTESTRVNFGNECPFLAVRAALPLING